MSSSYSNFWRSEAVEYCACVRACTRAHNYTNTNAIYVQCIHISSTVIIEQYVTHTQHTRANEKRTTNMNVRRTDRRTTVHGKSKQTHKLIKLKCIFILCDIFSRSHDKYRNSFTIGILFEPLRFHFISFVGLFSFCLLFFLVCQCFVFFSEWISFAPVFDGFSYVSAHTIKPKK